MSRIGKARNARLNQAMKHALEVRDNLALLVGNRSDKFIAIDDPWADARDALDQLVQCFHEANAYNNSMQLPEREVAEDVTALTKAANVSSPGQRT